MCNNNINGWLTKIIADKLYIKKPEIPETKHTKKINPSKPETKKTSVQLTPAFIHKLINGDIKEPSITINGVTHYRYADVDPSQTAKLSNGISLHKDTKAAFEKMQKAAASDGINLQVISGIRTSQYQKGTFRKKGTTAEILKNRVKESAPPGYSEHHTGLAIDINSVDPKDFKKGGKYYKTYLWLQQNAARFGFEQSFKANNAQGLMEEAWHWRFVGNDKAKKVFASARKAA